MKLFKKLFLQIFLAFLVLSQAVFFYLLYESRRQAVESIQHYEKLSFQGKTGELDQKLRGMYETEEQEIQDRIVASMWEARESFTGGRRSFLISVPTSMRWKMFLSGRVTGRTGFS